MGLGPSRSTLEGDGDWAGRADLVDNQDRIGHAADSALEIADEKLDGALRCAYLRRQRVRGR